MHRDSVLRSNRCCQEESDHLFLDWSPQINCSLPHNIGHSHRGNNDSYTFSFNTYCPREVYPCSQPSWQSRPLSSWLGWHQSTKSGVPGWEWVLLRAVPFALSQSSNGNLPQTTWPAWWSSELCPPVWKQDSGTCEVHFSYKKNLQHWIIWWRQKMILNFTQCCWTVVCINRLFTGLMIRLSFTHQGFECIPWFILIWVGI